MAGLWALLTVIGTWRHASKWTTDMRFLPDLPAPIEGVFSHAIDNMLHMMALPGWILVAKTLGRESIHLTSPALMANGVAVAMWITLFWITLRLRRVVHSFFNARRAGVDGAAPHSFSIARRRFLFDAPLTLAGAGAFGVAARSTLIDPWGLAVRRYRVAIRGLPASFEGMRIAHVSDLHCGPRVARAFLDEAIERAIAIKPDVYLLTGDYVSHGPDQIPHAAELVSRLVNDSAARFGVVGVLGNHDWYAGGRRVRDALRSVGAHMVDNDRIFLDGAAGRVTLSESGAPGAESLCIAGLGDLYEDIQDPAAALASVDASTPRLVLAHHPDTAELPQLTQRIDLMLSGHTHGGQVRLPFIGAPIVSSSYGQKYVGGLVQGPLFPVVVSRGVGMSILPVRLGVAPELVEIELRRA